MRYYFQHYKAIPKRRRTVDELVDLLEIEKATRDAFDKNAEDERDEMDVVSAADGVPDVRTVVVEHWHAHLKGGAML